METGCVYTITGHIRPPDDKPAAGRGLGFMDLFAWPGAGGAAGSPAEGGGGHRAA